MGPAVKIARPVRPAGLLLLAFVLATAGLLLAADPGSKDDPLVTATYVAQHAQFVRYELPAGGSLRLSSGAELVLAEPLDGPVALKGLDPLRDTVIDLTAGSALALPELTGCHHYINASNHDVFMKPEIGVIIMLRGEWK